MDGDADADIGYLCERCGMREPSRVVGPLDDAIADARRCLERDGVTIDRAHVELVHARLGVFAVPLESWLAERARLLRPELANASRLVADVDATLVHPAELWQLRFDRLIALRAPSSVVDATRRELVRLEGRVIRLEWERVHPWPALDRYSGTVGFGVIARVVAGHVLRAIFGDDAREMLAAIERAIATLSLDDEDHDLRARLDGRRALAAANGDRARAAGLGFAIRCLDELGHTHLRDDQDTLVDAARLTLVRAGRIVAAEETYRLWLDSAVPKAREAIATSSAA